MKFNLLGYLVFAFVTSITPGPNNLMLLSYGKAYGFADSGKVMLGIVLGFLIMLYLAGYGVAQIVTNNSTVALILRIVGSLWMFYLAIVLSKLTIAIEPNKRIEIGFGRAFTQQFANPKAWIMAISGAGTFMPQSVHMHMNVFIFAMTFGLVGIPCMLVWLKMGDIIARIIKSERAHRIAGFTIFALMIVSIGTIWIE
jgi:threonine/homoserine/homoserine lactone efflux protein